MRTEVSAIGAVSTQLAYDLASGLWEKEVVLQKHGVSPEDWETLRRHPRFTEIAREALDYWNGRGGQDRRIRAKAKLMLEESLPTLFAIAGANDAPPSARLAAIERMEKLSGISADEAAASGGGPTFQIQINLGDQTVDIRGKPPAISAEAVEDIEDIDYDDVDAA